MSTTTAPAPKIDRPSTSAATMQSLVKHHAGAELELQQRPIPEPGPREVLIKVKLAGICGTDKHIWQWDEWAAGRIPVGIITGHEFVGHVEKVGSAVRRVEPGRRVSAEGHITAGSDYNARTGAAHIATDTKILGIDRDGCFAEYVCVPEENVWPVHADVPDRFAAAFDPLGNAVHTVLEAGVSAKSVLITGAGIIGLMAVTVAKAAGAARIYVTDVSPERLALAKKIGATVAYDARDPKWVDDLKQDCWKRKRTDGVDVFLEISGAPPAIDAGFTALRSGGTAALLGLPSKPITFDLNKHVIFKGCKVLGINGRKMFETWYQTEELLLSGRLELDDIITHTFPMSKYDEAFDTMVTGRGIKVLMEVDK